MIRYETIYIKTEWRNNQDVYAKSESMRREDKFQERGKWISHRLPV